MNDTIRTVLLTVSFTAALLVSVGNGTAQEPKDTGQPASGTSLSQCTVYLKPEYVGAIKPAILLEDNKLVGEFQGFEASFAKFHLKDSKDLIFIPQSAILYMTGKQKFINF